MKTIKERRRALVEETAAHFNSTNRAIRTTTSHDYESKGCTYLHSANGGCAIGRLVNAGLAKELERVGGLGYGGDDGDQSIENEYLFMMLPDDLKELGKGFLASLQGFHDSYYYWTDHGLSTRGQQRKDYMITTYCTDEPPTT